MIRKRCALREVMRLARPRVLRSSNCSRCRERRGGEGKGGEERGREGSGGEGSGGLSLAVRIAGYNCKVREGLCVSSPR